MKHCFLALEFISIEYLNHEDKREAQLLSGVEFLTWDRGVADSSLT